VLAHMYLYKSVCFAKGCFGFERKLPDPAQRVVVTTRSHDTEAVRQCIAACEPTEVVRVGGAGHKVIARYIYILISFCYIFSSLLLHSLLVPADKKSSCNRSLTGIRSISGDCFVFQQDGAPAHRSCHTVELLHAHCTEIGFHNT